MQEMLETWVQPLGQEDPLEKEMATHSSILAWRILWTEEPGGLPSVGSHRVGPDWSDLAAAASIFVWRIPWTEEPHGLQYGSQRDTTEQLTHISLSSVHSVMSNSFQPHGLQQARLPCPSPTPGDCSNSCPLNWWCHPTISSSVIPFSCLQYFPAGGSFPTSSSSHQVAKVLEFQLQDQSFWWIFRTDFLQDWLVWSPCCARDPQESSPVPQFKSINSLALSFLYSPALTSIHDYWKNHSFD